MIVCFVLLSWLVGTFSYIYWPIWISSLSATSGILSILFMEFSVICLLICKFPCLLPLFGMKTFFFFFTFVWFFSGFCKYSLSGYGNFLLSLLCFLLRLVNTFYLMLLLVFYFILFYFILFYFILVFHFMFTKVFSWFI